MNGKGLVSPSANKEPRRFDQVPGGCWPACLAGLTGINHDVLAALVPPSLMENLQEKWPEYHNAIVETLHRHGWTYAALGTRVPRGFAIGIGRSPRGVDHSCIVLNGHLWHDPHESRAGVERFTSFEIVVPIVEVLS